MPRADFFTFLVRSLWLIAMEQPQAHNALLATLATMQACLHADGVARWIRFDGFSWTIHSGGQYADLDVAFDMQIILDLVDGQFTLEQAIAQERLRVRGSSDVIERFYRALLIYLEALIRSSGATDLLSEFRLSILFA